MIKKKSIIVYTAGSFDIFHIGHLSLLERSKKLGDTLIVGVSTDELIYSMKGAYPVIPFKERVRIVSALECVDTVITQTTLLHSRTLLAARPNIITLGSDWKERQIEGLEWAKRNGIEVKYLPYTKGVSTTQIKEKIIKNSYDIIKAQLKREEYK